LLGSRALRMPFPEVRRCIVCEHVRPEMHRKLTILGFYGITPDVSIRIQELVKPIEQIAFLLICGPSEGGSKANVSFGLHHEDGTELSTGIEGSTIPIPKNERPHLTIGIRNVLFPKTGRYIFAFNVDGRLHFEAHFDVTLGTPEDFKG
jgi:hypothetical protein